MNDDALDRLIHADFPEILISEERLESLICETQRMTRIAAVTRPRPAWLSILPWFASYAMPATIAVILGIVVSNHLNEQSSLSSFETLLLTSSLLPMGS